MIDETATATAPAEAASTELAKAPEFCYQPLMQVGTSQGLRGLAEAMRDKIAAVVPRHITAERMLKALFVAASKNPKLLQCTQESIIKSLMDASALGLDCSGTLGSAYLVPFNNKKKDPATGRETWVMECTLIPGYRGLIDLARRGGQIASIEAHAVFAQDKFSVTYGTAAALSHTPYLGADRRSEKKDIICFYAVGHLRDGSNQIEVMTLADVEAIRKRSKTYDRRQDKSSGPWATDYVEMGRKTAVRRICKYLPLSPELEKALDIADDAEGPYDDITIISPEALGNLNRTEDLADRLDAESQPANAPPPPPASPNGNAPAKDLFADEPATDTSDTPA